jgi:FkbM family methyltransferase
MRKRPNILKRALKILREQGTLSLLKKILYRLRFVLKKAQWRYFGFIGKTRIYREVQESMMSLNVKDQGLSFDLFRDGIREPRSTEFLRDLIKSGMVVVDIGANIGYYVLIESRLVGKKGHVYAIEPSPVSLSFLEENIELNNITNVSVHHQAVGNKESTAKLVLYDKANLNHIYDETMPFHSIGNTLGEMEVPITKIDNFLQGRKPANLIRMDVESYEWEVIEGMQNTLRENKELKLFIEIHGPMLNKRGHSVRVLLEKLHKSGFVPITIFMDINEIRIDNISMDSLINQDLEKSYGKFFFGKIY